MPLLYEFCWYWSFSQILKTDTSSNCACRSLCDLQASYPASHTSTSRRHPNIHEHHRGKNRAVDSYCSVQEWWQWEKATVVEKHQLGKCLTSESSPKQMQTNQKHEKALNKLPKSDFLELLTIKWLCKLIKPSVSVQGVHSPIVLAIAHSDNRELVRWGKAAVKALWS